MDYDDEYLSRCPACGDGIDFCQGHGQIGDPRGYEIRLSHERGEHDNCHPEADCQ